MLLIVPIHLPKRPEIPVFRELHFSVPQLEEIVEKSLVFQRDELKRDIDVKKTMKIVFSQKQDMPQWMRNQIKKLGFKFKHEKDNRE